MRPMHPIAMVAAILAAVIHTWFFAMESLWFMRPSVWRRFGLQSEADAKVVRPWAYNQGFYNLFLAVATCAGVVLTVMGQIDAGRGVVLAACGSMIGAGVVLYLTNRSFLRAAVIQLLPALVTVVSMIALR
jgi:putative membrane protein